MHVLVTGGAGYIGSHTCVELLGAGHRVSVLDSLCNSSPLALRGVEKITGNRPEFYHMDLRDSVAVNRLLRDGQFDGVLHFAGLKAVGESAEQPLTYFDVNVAGTLTLLKAMQEHGPRKLVFSSSATVYGAAEHLPIGEEAPLKASNPYGRSKLMVEEICRDVARARPVFQIILLRYFNPVGAHPSGFIGEDPRGVPMNLLPYAMQVAVGRRPMVTVFGNDYPTPDGTGVRDYIHVVDLAQGHLAALAHQDAMQGCDAINLGTGRGFSVLEVLRAASRAAGREIPSTVGARRPGDVAACYADPGKAARTLGWRANRGLDEMCADAWRWQRNNPNGYAPLTP